MTAEIGQRIEQTFAAFTFAHATGSVAACGAIVYELENAAASVSYLTYSSLKLTLYSILTSDLVVNN
jgi:hypothetical protein